METAESPEGFLRYTRDHLGHHPVITIRNEERKGWDVAVVVDGTYASSKDAENSRKYHERWLKGMGE